MSRSLSGTFEGSKTLVTLSVPIILSQLAQIAASVVDVVMAGRIGSLELGSISTGAALWSPMMIFLLGMLYVLTPMTGLLMGQQRENQIRSLAAQGVVLGLLVGLILGAALYFGAGPLFSLANVSADLVPGAVSYARIVALAFPGLALFLTFRFLLEASGGALLVTLSMVAGIILKIILNQALVFGRFGFPTLGIDGFAVSTVIVFWTMAVILLAMILGIPRFRYLKPGITTRSQLAPSRMFELARKGLPIALSFLSDYLVMAVVILFIATISPVAVSSHQIVFNIISVLLMITTGIGMAGTITVSGALGSLNPVRVRQAAAHCLVVSILTALAISVVLGLFGDTLVRFYSHDARIHDQAGTVIRVAALLFTVNVAAITLGFILRGMAHPGTPLVIMAAAHWGISIPLGYLLAETSVLTPPLGLIGWWYGLFTGVILATPVLAWRVFAVLANPFSSRATQRGGNPFQ